MFALAAAALAFVSSATTSPSSVTVPPTFTYQGELQLNGEPFNGQADLVFRLVDQQANVVAAVTLNDVHINQGLFTVPINFDPDLFDGTPYAIEILTRTPPGSGSFIALNPAQPIESTPYAFHANTADFAESLSAPAIIDAPLNGPPALAIITAANNGNAGSLNLLLERAATSNDVSLFTNSILNFNSVQTDIGIIGTSRRFPLAAYLSEPVSPGNVAFLQLESEASSQSIGLQVSDLRPGRGVSFIHGPTFAANLAGDLLVRGDALREYTPGSQDLIHPIAYGYVNTDGTLAAATPNINSVYNAAMNQYEIEIDDTNYVFNEFVTAVSPTFNNVTFRTASGGGRLIVEFRDRATGAPTQSPFQFVTYQPSGAAEVQGQRRPPLTPLPPTTPLDEQLQPRQLPARAVRHTEPAPSPTPPKAP